MQALKSVSFAYVLQQDRILAAINIGTPEAWSCWLTRRVTLALLDKTAKLVTNTGHLTQRAPREGRAEVAAFEREAAMATTADRMTPITADALHASAKSAELVDRISIGEQGGNFRLELSDLKGGAAAGVLRRAGFLRITQMLQVEVAKAGWLELAPKPHPARQADNTVSKRSSH